MQSTAFYDKHAQDFYDRTVTCDLNHLYEPFLAELIAGAHILDAGCGSGRDSLAFKQRGYRVTSMDGSKAMVELSTQLLGQPVLHGIFQEIDRVEEFDGIWACASLLHVPRADMDDVLRRLARALKSAGILFASFKYGDKEEERDGRWFNFYDETSIGELLTRHPGFLPVRVWTSRDTRPEHQDELWLDLLLKKQGSCQVLG